MIPLRHRIAGYALAVLMLPFVIAGAVLIAIKEILDPRTSTSWRELRAEFEKPDMERDL